jgi:tetratricopeptide (TPR) repeat protein
MGPAAFCGRDVELEQLRCHLERALSGRGSVCFVTGEPGAGKSSLLAEFVARAQDARAELLTAAGRCNAYGGIGDPYLPFKDILRQLTGDVDQSVVSGQAASEGTSRLRAFMTFARQMLVENGPDLIDLFMPGGGLLTRIGGRAVGQLRARDRQDTRAHAMSKQLTPENVHEQYAQVLEAMSADRPLLLLVDDLHWADASTLSLLFHLARRLVNDPVLIVGAYRREEVRGSTAVAHPLFGIAAELQRLHGVIDVDLDGTNPRRFVDALLDQLSYGLDEEFRDALTRHTSGNALFIVELLRNLEQTGVLARDERARLVQRSQVTWGALPSQVAAVVESRLGRLTRGDRNILSAAAVQGEEFDADVVARVCGEARRTVVTLLSGVLAKEHHLVIPIGLREIGDATLATYRFRHNLVQDYLYSALDPVECSELHAGVGEAIEALHGTATAASAAVLARHYERAGLHSRALVWRLRSAEASALGCAPSQSIAEFEAALELQSRRGLPWPVGSPNRSTVIERLGEQLLLVGRYDDAAQRFRECLDDGSVTEGEARSRIWRKYAESHERANRYDDALAAIDRAQASLGPEPLECAETWWQLWIDAELGRSGIHYWRNDPVQMVASEQRLRTVVDRWGSPLQRSRCHYEFVRQALRRSRYRADAAMVANARLAIADLDPSAAGSHEGELWFGLGFANLWADALPEAREAMEQSLAIAHRVGSAMLKARCLTYLGLVHRRLGHDDEVARLNDQAREYVAQSGAANYAAMTAAQDAWLAWRRHDSSAALTHVDRAIATWAAKSPGFPVQWPGWWMRIALAAASRDKATVAAAMRALLAPTQARPPDDVEDALHRALASHDATDTAWWTDVLSAIERAEDRGLL